MSTDQTDSEASGPAKPEPDKRLELAYDAAKETLKLQDATLTNTRTRANNLLAATALFISFAAGVGLINTDPKRGAVFPAWAALILLLVVVGLGIAVTIVAWPTKDWCWGPSAKVILDMTDEGKSEAEIRRFMTKKMIAGRHENHEMLAPKQKAFRWASGLLFAEVVVLVAGLIMQLEGIK